MEIVYFIAGFLLSLVITAFCILSIIVFLVIAFTVDDILSNRKLLKSTHK